MSESLRSPPVWFISCFGLQPETLQEKRNWIPEGDSVNHPVETRGDPS